MKVFRSGWLVFAAVTAVECGAVIPEPMRHILGGQTFLWSEQVPNESWIQWKMWPRALAMSEVLWSGPRKRSFAAFKDDADSVVRKLRNAGFNAALHNGYLKALLKGTGLSI